MNLSWPSCAIAWRRACWSPRARGSSRAPCGARRYDSACFAACGGASVPECPGLLLALSLRGPERQAACIERLLDLLDGLSPEVRDRVQLRLGLLDQLAHGLDAGALQAVVRPDAQLELLDQDVVHPVGAPRRGRPGDRR